MAALEELLRKRWILKSKEKDAYYRIREELPELRKFAMEKLGCQIIENSLLVKLEKIPAKPENFMGIGAFSSTEEYAFLCMVLMFLEDKEAEEQFVLSQLTEYIAAGMVADKVDWTLYTCRRRLIKVLRYCIDNGMIYITDGSDDVFAGDNRGEVLYENTGASKYFMRNFTRDIMTFTQPEDFVGSDWVDINEDRGMARRHRVYKRLLFSVGMYKEPGKDEDFEYLKYYGGRVADDLEQAFDCQLQLHKTSAYLIAGPDCRIGSGFPENNTLSDILMLCNQLFLAAVTRGELTVDADECIRLSRIQLEQIIRSCKEQYGSGFPKLYREKTGTEFVDEIRKEMERVTFLAEDRKNAEWILLPIIGKIIGRYPADYEGKVKLQDEQQMAGK